ncbi:MAG: dienelactone hydrolase family protein, partial [Planctomycetota bacterium]
VRWNTNHLEQMMASIISELNVDESRLNLTGLSMGGSGTWSWAAHQPQRFAAIAPICGFGNPVTAEKLLDQPIWAFHGGDDKVVPPSGSQNIVDAIKLLGGTKVKLTVYEGVDHNSWTETYANPKLYEWFLDQKREAK